MRTERVIHCMIIKINDQHIYLKCSQKTIQITYLLTNFWFLSFLKNQQKPCWKIFKQLEIIIQTIHTKDNRPERNLQHEAVSIEET